MRARRFWRFLLAILAGGTAATATGVPAAALISLLRGQGGDDLALLWEVWATSLLLLPVGVMFTLLGGMPVHVVLRLMSRTGPIAHGLGGAVAGAVVLSLMLYVGADGFPTRSVALGGTMGLAAGLAFRAVWRPMAR